jgi:hypothetical protein
MEIKQISKTEEKVATLIYFMNVFKDSVYKINSLKKWNLNDIVYINSPLQFPAGYKGLLLLFLLFMGHDLYVLMETLAVQDGEVICNTKHLYGLKIVFLLALAPFSSRAHLHKYVITTCTVKQVQFQLCFLRRYPELLSLNAHENPLESHLTDGGCHPRHPREACVPQHTQCCVYYRSLHHGQAKNVLRQPFP